MIKLFELFAGYGGASFALKKAKIPFECVGFSEVDKYAIKCYNNNHGDIKNFGDCSKIVPEELPDFNLLTGGFPCPTFSIQGNRAGFEDERGQLFFDIIRIAKVKQPKYMLLENVKGLTNHEEGKTLSRILNEIKSIGYDVIYKVLNSKEHGIPQTRQRVWFVCKLGKWDFNEFQFPLAEELKLKVFDLLEDKVDNKYYLSKKQIAFILDEKRQKKKFTQVNGQIALCQTARQYASWNGEFIADYRQDEGLRIRKDGCSPTLTTPTGGGLQHKIIIHSLQSRSIDRPSMKEAIEQGKSLPGGHGALKRTDGVSYCLDTSVGQAIEYDGIFRQLTPRECFRLMGFLNDEINIDELSDRQLYRLSGNGWCISEVSKIFKNMLTSK